MIVRKLMKNAYCKTVALISKTLAPKKLLIPVFHNLLEILSNFWPVPSVKSNPLKRLKPERKI